MKHFLLPILIIFFSAVFGFAQDSDALGLASVQSYEKQSGAEKNNVRIYPNPATNYFQVVGSNDVEDVIIYNIFGRKVKSFEVRKGQKYDIETLPMGMYLVQMLDKQSKVIATRRLSKRMP